MSYSHNLPSNYYFRKLYSKIYAIAFFNTNISSLRDQVNFHIMKTLFFSHNDYKRRFVHFTQNKTEMSLFLDKNSYEKFIINLPSSTKETLVSNNTCYMGVEVFTDTCDLDTVGVTAFIATKFAEKNIPIIYTNSYNSSFILFGEEYVEKATEIFRKVADNKDSSESTEEE